MPDFSHLLSYADFGNALFTQLQAEAGVKQVSASYGNAERAELTELRLDVDALRQVSGTSGVIVTIPEDIEIPADYLGVPTPDPFPIDFNVGVELLGTDVLTDPRTEVIFTASNLTGTETSDGVFQVTSVDAEESSLRVLVNFAGVKQGEWLVYFRVNKAAPPPPITVEPVPPIAPSPTPTPPPPPPAAPSPAQSFFLSTVNSSVFVLAGQINVNGGFTYDVNLITTFRQVLEQLGIANVTAYVARKSGNGNWEKVGADALGSPTESLIDNEPPLIKPGATRPIIGDSVFTSPGQLKLTRSVVLPEGVGAIGVFTKLLYGNAVKFAGPVIIEPA